MAAPAKKTANVKPVEKKVLPPPPPPPPPVYTPPTYSSSPEYKESGTPSWDTKTPADETPAEPDAPSPLSSGWGGSTSGSDDPGKKPF